jgi:hypothetical protein
MHRDDGGTQGNSNADEPVSGQGNEMGAANSAPARAKTVTVRSVDALTGRACGPADEHGKGSGRPLQDPDLRRSAGVVGKGGRGGNQPIDHPTLPACPKSSRDRKYKREGKTEGWRPKRLGSVCNRADGEREPILSLVLSSYWPSVRVRAGKP